MHISVSIITIQIYLYMALLNNNYGYLWYFLGTFLKFLLYNLWTISYTASAPVPYLIIFQILRINGNNILILFSKNE